MNGKRFNFNAVDFFICIVVLFTIVFYSFYLNNIRKEVSANEIVSAEIIVEVDKIKIDYLQGVNSGDTVIFADDGSVLGEIKQISVSDVYVDNSPENIIDTELKKALIIIECDLLSIDDYLYLADKKIIIGETYKLIVPEAYILAECISVNVLD